MPANKYYLRIQDAAEFLGVSSKTLRRWEKSGKLIPLRSHGNQRKYTRQQLENILVRRHAPNVLQPKVQTSAIEPPKAELPEFLKAKPNLTSDLLMGGLLSARPRIKQLSLPLLLLALALSAGVGFSANSSLSRQGLARLNNTENSQVLAATTSDLTKDQILEVAIPATFTQDITAPNVIYSLKAGDGIAISTGQTPTISSTQVGWKTITVAGTSLTPATSSATLSFTAGTGISLSTSGGNTITVTNSLPSANTSGWTDGGTSVYLQTITDLVGIGTSSPAHNLDVAGTFGVTGNTYLGSLLTVGGDTTIGTGTPVYPSANPDLYVQGNLEVGGTIYGTIAATINPGFTTGSVIFQGPSGMAQNNANFFWDDTHNRLGIGTTSPAEAVEIGGTGNIRVGGLTASSGVYTDINKTLTSILPSDGSWGYWTRSGTTLSPHTNTDDISTLGNLAINGGNITSTASTFNLVTSATTLSIGAATGNTTVNNTLNVTGTTYLNGIANIGDTGDAINLSGTTISLTANGAGNDITAHLVDNNTDALNIQEASNNYININTTNAAENITFGNTTTNPTFSFLGSGATTFNGNVNLAAGNSLYLLSGAGKLGLGTNVPNAKLEVTGTVAGKALAIFNDTGTDQNILVASASGTPVLTVDRSGRIALATWNGAIIGATYGGTGQSTWTTGDLLYASGTDTLAKRAAGSAGQALIMAGGVPTWGTISGSICTDCLITDPALTQILTPTSSTATGLSVAQASSGSVDIFNVTNFGGGTKYFYVDSAGTATMTNFKLPTGAHSGYALISDAYGVGSWTDTTGTGSFDAWTLSGSTVYPNQNSYDLLLGSTSAADAIGKFTVSGTKAGKALAIFNDTGTDQNILVASASGTPVLTIDRSGTLTTSGNVAINGSGALTTTSAAFNLINTTASTLNIGGAATTVSLGNSSGATTVNNQLAINNATLSTNQTVFNLINTTASTLNIGGAATTLSLGAPTGNTTVNNTLNVTGTTYLNGIANIGDTGDAINLSGTTISLTANGAGNDITAHLVDNNTDALNIQEASNNYININTTNAAENITFGNTTTNPKFIFTGSGNVGIGTVSPGTNLSVVGGVGIGTSASFAGAAIAANNLAVQGSVGIGTTAPAGLLDIASAGTTTNDFRIVNTALTTGTLGYLSSTSTALSTGSLLSLDWSPSGSTTIYGTGDLFSINAGQYGSAGNLLNIKDNGSSVFSVSQAQVTANIPAAFNAAGDVGIAYDLVLTNQTASNIKSLGPLTIESGENFESNNLTLRSFNTGNVIVDAQSLIANYSATVSSQLVVGTASPTAASFGNFYLTNSATFGKALAILNQTEAQPILVASVSGVNKFIIDGSGNVGIGNTNPGGNLDVTNATVANGGKLVNLNGTFTTTTSSGTGYGLYGSWTNANGTNADTAYGIYNTMSDAVALANTDYGLYSVVSNTGALNAAATKTIYGGYLSATGTGATTNASVGTNVYGLYLTTTASNATDNGTVNQYGLYVANGTSSTNGTSSKYGLYIETPTGADNNYAAAFAGGNVGISTTAPAYKVDIATSTANDRGIDIANTAATGTNYGMYSSVTGAATTNYGGYFISTGATTDYGIAVAALTGATSTGLDIGAMTGSLANKGINIGNISTGTSTDYAINLGTLTGGTGSSGYQINAGNVTAVASGTWGGINLGTITPTTSATTYGINIGNTLAGAGTATYGINIGTNASTATNNYGIKIGAISGAGTTNTGLYVDTVSNATNNYAAIFAGGNVGVGTAAPTAVLHLVGSQPASVGTTPGTAATGFELLTGGTGGNTSIATTGIGGIGAAWSVTGGTGGTADSAVTADTGGVGGAFTLTTGTGGAAGATAGIKIGGAGGAFSILGGAGGATTGAGTSNTGGAGGNIYLAGGTGGTASGATANTAGAAGNVLLAINSAGTAIGNVGIGTTAPGAKLDISSSSTAGPDLRLINTGVATGSLGVFTADSLTTGKLFDLSVDGLTSGTGFNLQSTSTVLSSGSLMALDWSPTGSTTIYATGDLFSINAGQYGSAGNLLNIKDNGSSVFSVSQTAVTANIPLTLNAAGDATFAYDINLINPSNSTIKSASNLVIQSGEVFNSSNLTLRTFNAGNVIVDSQAFVTNYAATVSGQLVVGTSTPTAATFGNFYLTNSATFGKALAILNQTETQDILTASVSGVPKFLVDNNGSIYMGNNTTIASSTAVCWIAATVNGVTLYQLGDCTGTPADLAEFYPVQTSDQSLTAQAGLVPSASDVVTIGPSLGSYTTADGQTHQAFSVVKANTEYDQKMIGVISTKSWQVMGKDVLEWADSAVPVALTGRVPVKIASTSAEIKAGDLLTSSTVPGEAMKATSDGYTLGKSLEDWTPDSGKETILVYLNNSVNINNTLAEATSSATATNSADLATRLSILEGDVSLLKNQATLNNSVPAQFSVDSLTVNDQAILPDTIVNGDLSATGNLSSLKGNLILTAGKVMGNSTFRDTAVIPAGADHVVIQKSWDSAPVSVTVTAGYDTGVWVEKVTKTGFTIRVKNIPSVNSNVYWMAIW